MQAILEQLYRDLDQAAVRSVAERFDLTEDTAHRAVRLTAPSVLHALKDRLNAPVRHAGLLGEVIAHIADDRIADGQSYAAERAPSDLGRRLIEPEYQALIDTLQREAGLTSTSARDTVEALLPHLLRCIGAPHRNSGDMLAALSIRLGASGSGLRDVLNDLFPPPES